MIYLLITTSINNSYIKLENLIETYSDILKPVYQNEIVEPIRRNGRRKPTIMLTLGKAFDAKSEMIRPKSFPDLTVENVDRLQVKTLNTNDRISEYKESIKSLLTLNLDKIKPIIIENNGKRETFLDEYGIDVHYTENNRESFRHKGVNELMDIKSAISSYEIQDDDIIIKLTGRYTLLNDSFFKFIIKNENNFDAFIKFYNVYDEKFMDDDCTLGLFAIRCKYLKSFEYDEESEIPERDFAKYVIDSDCRICEIYRLGLHCKFSDTYKELDV
jgi:hypothetical protein